MFYICIFLLIIGILFYNSGQKDKGAIVFLFFLSNGFMTLSTQWIEGSLIAKYTDFALLYMLYVFSAQLFRGRNLFLTWNIKYQKWTLFLLLYLTGELIFTLTSKEELFNYSIATYRNYLLLLSYGIFREISQSQILKILKIVSYLILITTVLFILQPLVDDRLLFSGVYGSNGRYRNIPTLSYFFLIYISITIDFSNKTSVFLFAIFGTALLLTQHRTIMLAYVAIIILYLLLSKKFTRIVQYSFIGLLVALIAGSFLLDRFENEKRSTSGDISTAINMDFEKAAQSRYNLASEGTFSFRLLLFYERIKYLIDHPKLLPTGIGMRHEDSPFTKRDFNFILGSAKKSKKGNWTNKQQIESGDLVWMTPLLKFGIIGLSLYIIITLSLFRTFNKNKNISILAMSIYLYYTLLILISFKNDLLFAPLEYAFINLLAIFTSRKTIPQLKFF